MTASSRHWSLTSLSGDVLVYRRFEAPRGATFLGPGEASSRVREWLALQPGTAIAIHDEVVPRTSNDLRGNHDVRRETLARGLEEAFMQGDLVALRVPLIFPVRKVDLAPPISRAAEALVDEQEKKTWIEINVKDALGKAAKDIAYKLRTPDGKWRDGKTDGSGKIRLDDVHPGDCELVFPPPTPPT